MLDDARTPAPDDDGNQVSAESTIADTLVRALTRLVMEQMRVDMDAGVVVSSAPHEDALTADELRQKLRIDNANTFFKHQSAGKFERFQLRPQLGRQRLYSRKLVQAYLDREPTDDGTTRTRKK
jgi:hypothetical protein